MLTGVLCTLCSRKERHNVVVPKGVMCLVAGCIMCGHNIMKGMARCHSVHIKVYMSHSSVVGVDIYQASITRVEPGPHNPRR